jgi:hypothetical protein
MISYQGQLELPLSEPPPMNGSPELDFDLTLKDGSRVSVHYERSYFSDSAQVEFNGESISSTGYYSYFPPYGCSWDIPDEEVIKAAASVAELLREKRLAAIAKEERRGKRRR